MLIIDNTESGANILRQYLASTKKVPVFDIDGVIADASHRIELHADGSLNLEHYRANTTAEQVARDKALPLAAVASEYALNSFICTARVLCQHSMSWLFKQGITPIDAGHRGSDSNRMKDATLKANWLAQFGSKVNQLVLIDDCLANCLAAQSLGCSAVWVQANVKA